MSQAVTSSPAAVDTEGEVSQPAGDGYMSHREVLRTLTGLLLGMFVAILSSTVVSNALPTIVNDLNGTQSGYTWVVTATLLATTISTPIWGKLADLMSKKVLVQTALVIFAVASIVAGLSQNMTMLITTRVFQGLGVGGLTALSQVILASIVSPRERGRYSGYLGATFALGTVAGPLIGGALTEHLSWHWCFFVGVPFAILAIIVLQFTLHMPVHKQKVHIDYLGAILLGAGVSSLLIWVSLAGDKFDWMSWQTAAMVGGGIALLLLTVMAEQIAPEPMIPLRLFRSRVTTLASIASLFVGVGMFATTVFLGQYFQLARGDSPTKAGLMTLPMIAGLFLSSTISGQIITRTGRWKAWLVSGGVLLTAGLGLLATIKYDTDFWLVSIFMFLVGTGIGMMMQNLVLAVQNEVSRADLGAASSFVAFTRTLGGAIGVSAMGAVLANRVKDHLTDNFRAAGVRPDAMGDGTGIPNISALPNNVRPLVEDAYGKGIADVFLVAAPFAAIAFLITLFIRETTLRSGELGETVEPAELDQHDEHAEHDEQDWDTDEEQVAHHEEPAADTEAQQVAVAGAHPVAAAADEKEGADMSDGSTSGDDDAAATRPAVVGTVLQGGGRPMPGAQLTLADQSGQQVGRAVSGADGSYRMDLESGGTFLLIVAAPNVAPRANLVAVTDGPSRHNVTLEGTSAITGRVLRTGADPSSSTPLAEALVTITDVTGQVVDSVRTLADGAYSFNGLSSGSYVLTAQSGNHRPQARLVQVTEAGAVAADLTLRAGGSITGAVSASRDGRSVPDASVTLTDGNGQVVAAAITGADGRYTFDNVGSGTYTLTASGFGPVSQQVVIEDDRVVSRDVRLGAPESASTPVVGRR